MAYLGTLFPNKKLFDLHQRYTCYDSNHKTRTLGKYFSSSLNMSSSFSQPSPKMLTLSIGGCSHIGVPCSGSLLGRVEREGGVTISDQYPKVSVPINQVSPKSLPLKEMKGQPLQSLFLGELRIASFQPCS